VLKDEALDCDERYTLIMFFDQVFGLGFASVELPEREDFPSEALALLEKRLQAKKEKNWQLADRLRSELDAMGYRVKDTPTGSSLEKKM
jgi:cysteinyl-tRNA synthetase